MLGNGGRHLEMGRAVLRNRGRDAWKWGAIFAHLEMGGGQFPHTGKWEGFPNTWKWGGRRLEMGGRRLEMGGRLPSVSMYY